MPLNPSGIRTSLSPLVRSIRRRQNLQRLAYFGRRHSSGVTAHPDVMTGEMTALPDIMANRVDVQRNTNPTPPPPSNALVFGNTFTDHMLTIPWSILDGWGTPKIHPCGRLSLHPSSTVLHYAQTVFEGMKAYRDVAGKVRMFRPEMNMARMNRSCERLSLPTFDGGNLLELIKRLVYLDRHWIPTEPGHSLYIRPTMIGTQSTIALCAPKEALLFVILSPAGPFFPTGFKPVALHATTEYIRAAPGGTGSYKLGANYAPSVRPLSEAAKEGYVQNLWLHGPEGYLTEVGTMNMFVVLKTEDGGTELITPPLDGMILPGITRDSVLSLARSHISGEYKLPNLPSDLRLRASERPVTMSEILDASRAGRLVELFGAGTAAIICPVGRIGYRGEDIEIPTGEDGMGPVSRALWKEIVGRQTGKIESDWSVEVTG